MITWRKYVAETDLLDVVRLHGEMEAKLGSHVDLPTPDQRPVLITIVGETDGKITHGIFLEATVECCAIGTQVLPAKDLMNAIEQHLLPTARMYKIRMARAWVPKVMIDGKINERKKPLERILERCGFELENGLFACFTRWI